MFLYPEMKGEIEDMNEMFSSMGAFSSAFGMDRLNFGTLIGEEILWKEICLLEVHPKRDSGIKT